MKVVKSTNQTCENRAAADNTAAGNASATASAGWTAAMQSSPSINDAWSALGTTTRRYIIVQHGGVDPESAREACEMPWSAVRGAIESVNDVFDAEGAERAIARTASGRAEAWNSARLYRALGEIVKAFGELDVEEYKALRMRGESGRSIIPAAGIPAIAPAQDIGARGKDSKGPWLTVDAQARPGRAGAKGGDSS